MNIATQKVSATPAYAALGQRLTQLRRKTGHQQGELARLVKTSQQSISRWEAGEWRPKAKQVPKLAKALGIEPEELFALAGYAPQETAVSFDKPFPIDGLDPHSFERFCQHFLERKYRDATVHAVGGQGHTQEGADIWVTFPDGTRHSFQCKRVVRFGPAKLREAVATHTAQAAKKIILLARIASPKTREAVQLHAGWAIWDKEDISRRVRELPKDEQVKLVDIFFPKQRFALLGHSAGGRWQTAEEFYAPYMAGYGAFSHDWPLIGRSEELRALRRKVEDDKVKVVLLTANGGGGKSRLVKEAIEPVQAARKALLIRFLNPTLDATPESLEELGTGEKLLVVDDAHDRTDLPLLFQYAAVPEHNARLLLSLRTYGLEYVKLQASNFGLGGEAVAHVPLQPLTLEQATALAAQVLERFNGPQDEAERIALVTRDCPLATVIGAQVIATDARHFDLAKNQELFRSTLLSKFQDIIAGRISRAKSEAEAVRKTLRVLALLQPFYPEDETVPPIVATVEGIEAYEVSRIIRSLTDAGVLFRRGGQYRLSPDLLADYIIEDCCVGPGGRSTGYAERVFAVAGDRHMGHVLLNLGKLDWRLANGQPTGQLLDGIWRHLSPSQEYGDPHIKAITSVAYYQPERALAFAERQIRTGQYLRDVPEIVKYAAYTYEYLPRACEALWELGKGDDRDLHSHPGHAIRILSELCAVQPDKPVSYNQAVVDFALSLLNRSDAWDYKYSPLDILTAILRSEGHTTHARGHVLEIRNFNVNLEAVAELREKVVDAVIELLSNENIKIGRLAAQALRETVHYPMNVGESARQKWTTEFVQTLAKVQTLVNSRAVDPLVLIEIGRAIAWHAHYGPDETGSVARRMLADLPSSPEFRTLLALVDGHGLFLDRYDDYTEHQKRWTAFIEALVADLVREYPDGESLRYFLERQIEHIKAGHPDASILPYPLFWYLIIAAPALAYATVRDTLSRPTSPTARFAAAALAKVIEEDRATGFGYVRDFLQAPAGDGLHAAAATAFSVLSPQSLPLSPDEIALFHEVLSSSNAHVAYCAVNGVRTIARGDQRLAIDLFRRVNIGLSKELADHVFMQFVGAGGDTITALTAEDADDFLNKLMLLPELQGHWVECFLSVVSKSQGSRLARFFMKRVDHAAHNDDWGFRPCNYGPYGHVPLRLRESPDFAIVLREMSEWMKGREGLLFGERSAQLFDTLFKPFDEALVAALRAWVDAATEGDIRVIAKIVGEAHPNFVFEHTGFVTQFLERAKQFGKRALEQASFELFSSAIGGVRSGTPGQPFPRDVQMKQQAEKAMAQLPRFSPAYALYESIARHADWDIKISMRDAESFEE
jgi:transcriptional regulator with XRE-family HTH domain